VKVPVKINTFKASSDVEKTTVKEGGPFTV
jgi:hypothetical protein